MLPDDQLDALLRAAKPSAPAGFEDRVMSSIGRPWMKIALLATLVLLGTIASTVAMMRRPTPTIASSGWFANGREIAQGTTVGKSELHSNKRAVSIEQSATVWRNFIRLDAGQALLLGDDIVVDTAPARVTTVSPDAEVEVAMNAKKVGATVVAAGAAVLSIHVLRGAAKVEPVAGASVQQPVLLAQGDRALVTEKRPPTILRAPHSTSAAAAPNTPNRSAAVQRPAGQPAAIQPPAPPIAPEPGSLDKDTIRTGVLHEGSRAQSEARRQSGREVRDPHQGRPRPHRRRRNRFRERRAAIAVGRAVHLERDGRHRVPCTVGRRRGARQLPVRARERRSRKVTWISRRNSHAIPEPSDPGSCPR
jgi:hypothetical protein